MRGLRILSISPTAIIQDRGRQGLLRFGVSPGGAMDAYALAEGQALLGNAADDAALEMAGHGGSFRAEGEVWVSLTGAPMQASLNGRVVEWRQSLHLRDGDTLRIGATVMGVYGYLHVAGGFQTEVVLNARSTHVRAGFGHLPKAGDLLPAGLVPPKPVPLALPRPEYFDQRQIRAIWGPQSHLFDDAERSRFAAAQFGVSDKRDRMGMQIIPDYPPFHGDSGLSIASDATLPGDIQIIGNGTPAVLLADRGPTGGYPRIATVITADIAALAQISSGERFAISIVDRQEAVGALLEYRRTIGALPGMAEPVLRDPRDMADLLSYNLIDGAITGENDEQN